MVCGDWSNRDPKGLLRPRSQIGATAKSQEAASRIETLI